MKKMILRLSRKSALSGRLINMNFSNFTTKSDTLSIKTQTVNLTTTIDGKTIADLSKEIRKLGNYEVLDYRIWDHSKVSSNTKLSAIKEPLYLKIQDSNWVELDFLRSPKQEDPSGEELLTQLTENLDYNSKERARRIFTRLRNHEYNTVENKLFSAKNTNLSSIIEELTLLKNEYFKCNLNEEKLRRSSEKKVLAVLCIAGLLFVVELLLVYYGTFIRYSWDITEPMTYLVTCANLVLLLLMRKKFGSLSAYDYLMNLFMRKRSSIHQLNELRRKISAIENKLN